MRRNRRPGAAVAMLSAATLSVPVPASPEPFAYAWGHPRPQGNTIFALAFATATDGWAVGGSGFVLRTTDGGVSWTLQHGIGEVAPDLWDLLVTPGGALLACGTGDGITRSTDDGATWTGIPNPAPAGLRDLALRPDGALSAAGEDGALVLSTDDGLTWASAGPGVGVIRHHAWRTASEAYAVGEQMAHRTTDGGATWAPFIPIEFLGYNEVYFPDPSTGYVVEDFGTWSTTDGGATWTEDFVPVPPLYRFRTLVLSASHWLLVCHGEGGELWETTDAGATWTNRFLAGSVGFPCIVQAPGGRVHFGSDVGDLFRTDDLGQNILNATATFADEAPFAAILSILPRPDGVLFAANQPTSGEPSMWIRSDDGGLTWTEPAGSPGFYWVAAGVFRTATDGLTARRDSVAVTTDGGDTWTYSALGAPSHSITSLAWPVPDAAFASTRTTASVGDLFESTDGGFSWTTVGGGLPAGTVAWSDVAFPTGSLGYAVGYTAAQSPRVHRTTDGGSTWAVRAGAGLAGPLVAAVWFGTDVGVVSQGGSSPGTFRTTDGGATFAPVFPERAAHLVRRSASEAVAIHSFSNAFRHTTDAGATWTEHATPLAGAFPGLTDVCTAAAPTAAGWVLGGGRNHLLVAIPASATAAPERPAQHPADAGLRLVSGPNPVPAGAAVRFSFRLPAGAAYRLTLHDVSGRRVREVATGRLAGGEQAVTWDGRDDAGRPASAGVYFARLTAAGRTAVSRVVRLE